MLKPTKKINQLSIYNEEDLVADGWILIEYIATVTPNIHKGKWRYNHWNGILLLVKLKMPKMN